MGFLFKPSPHLTPAWVSQTEILLRQSRRLLKPGVAFCTHWHSLSAGLQASRHWTQTMPVGRLNPAATRTRACAPSGGRRGWDPHDPRSWDFQRAMVLQSPLRLSGGGFCQGLHLVGTSGTGWPGHSRQDTMGCRRALFKQGGPTPEPSLEKARDTCSALLGPEAGLRLDTHAGRTNFTPRASRSRDQVGNSSGPARAPWHGPGGGGGTAAPHCGCRGIHTLGGRTPPVLQLPGHTHSGGWRLADKPGHSVMDSVKYAPTSGPTAGERGRPQPGEVRAAATARLPWRAWVGPAPGGQWAQKQKEERQRPGPASRSSRFMKGGQFCLRRDTH